MIHLRDLLQEAVQAGATELRLSSSGIAEIRTRTPIPGWHTLAHQNLGPQWTRENFLALLEAKEKQQLSEGHAISGVTLLPNSLEQIRYTLARGEQGFYGHFQWQTGALTLESYQLPALFFEALQKTNGFFLLSGPRLSGKTNLLKLLIGSESARGQAIAVFADRTDEYAELDPRVVIFQADQIMSSADLLTGFELIIVDSRKPAAWRQAVAAAETGSRVIATAPFVDMENAFERLAEKIEPQASIGLARLTAVTQMALSLRLMEGLDAARQPAVEILVVPREIREKIVQHKWTEVFQTMFQQGEKTGMRTLNQCLMNLMLKRKIDFKVGFAESPNPEELDSMLERIGV